MVNNKNNKILSLTSCLFAGLLAMACQPVDSKNSIVQNTPEWQDPQVIEVNRAPARANFFAYESVAKAKANHVHESANFLSLNGQWKFHWVDKPADKPIGFHQPNFDYSQWSSITVPGNVELQGHGKPHYLNIDYVFPANQPHIPADYNPVSSYIKTFELPENWQGDPVYIHFGAVNSVFYLWLNGKQVGYSEDSKLPAEFDLTAFLTPGENKLAVQVYRWADASYLEDQDGWSLSGIERDVYLYRRPQSHIQDVSVSASLDDSYNHGELGLTLDIAGIKADLSDLAIDISVRHQDNLLFNAKDLVVDGDVFTLQRQTIPNIMPWSAESPSLYQVYISLKQDGELQEVIKQNVGFRRLEMRNGLFLVNGKAVTIRGVNRVEHHATGGRTLTRESMEQDVALMKANNINAVRTAHFPNHSYLYELADKHGLYVMDEANIESHKYMQIGNQPDKRQQIDDAEASPQAKQKKAKFDRAENQKRHHLGFKAEWHKAHMARVSRMVARDKNHPSVVMWSLGNEAGLGNVFEDAAAWIKQHDPSRPVTYGGWGTFDGHTTLDYSDIYTPMYDSVEELADYVSNNPTKPLILAEYAHAMGNSVGNLDKYWSMIYANEQLQGGFIWDWVDQTLIKSTNQGKQYWAFGGDFEEGRSNTNFLANGLIQPDRTANPHLQEVKKIYQPVEFVDYDLAEQQLRLINRYNFLDLSHLSFTWKLQRNGVAVANGRLPRLKTAAGASQTVPLDLSAYGLGSDSEYHLLVQAQTSTDGQSQSIAWQQFALTPRVLFSHNPELHPLKVEDTQSQIKVAAKDTVFEFDKATGLLSRYQVAGVDIIEQGISGNFWRTQTDNDRGYRFKHPTKIWSQATLQQSLTDFSVQQDSHGVSVTTTHSVANDIATMALTYTMHGDGSLKVSAEFTPNQSDLPFIPRMGIHLQLNEGFQRFNWYGRGPHENYIDRKHSAAVGQYEAQVSEQLHDYSRPQESGTHSDTRTLSLRADGLELTVLSDQLFAFSALPLEKFDLLDISKVPLHSADVEHKSAVTLRLDHKHMGVGGDNSWGALPHPEYRIAAQPYDFEFTFLPSVTVKE